MLVQLGDFQFSLATLPLNELERVSQYRFAEHDRIGQPNLLQAVGQGNDSIRFSCEYRPEVQNIYGGKVNPLPEIDKVGAAQEPLLLMVEDGRQFGYWVIAEFSRRSTDFLQQGARTIACVIQIQYWGENI